MMTDYENEESLVPLLFMSDSDTMLRNLANQGNQSALEEIFGDENDSDDSVHLSDLDKLDNELENMNKNSLHATTMAESLKDSSVESSSSKKPARKKSKNNSDSSYKQEASSDEGSSSDDMGDADDEEELNMDKNTFDEDVGEKELDLPANRNRKVKGKAIEPNHCRRKLQRNMAAQGPYENRDITALKNIVSTSPRLKKILDESLPKWKPSFPLLVRSIHSPDRLGSCPLFF
jgi:hypothetical protein